MTDACLNCGSSEPAKGDRSPESRRVVFDPHYGRVWAVCAQCGFWNLFPIEGRWELLSGYEQQFATARSRVSAGAIAQAETASGEVLIRIGDAPFADLARYRYLDTSYAIGRRRYRWLLFRASLVVGVSVALFELGSYSLAHGVTRVFPAVSRSLAVLGSSLVALGLVTGAIRYWFWRKGRKLARKPFLTIETDDGPALIRWGQLRFVRVCSSTLERRWSLHVVHDKGESELRGPIAEFYLGLLIARVGQPLYSKPDLERALRIIEERGGADAFLASFALGRRGQSDSSGQTCVGLFQSPRIFRIAATIAVDECLDRRATEADLASLRAAARSAGEIAGIADNLLVPNAVTDALERLRSRVLGATTK